MCASPARRVVPADGEQAGVFALRTGVRLQRDGGEAGDLRQPAFQLLAHLAIARGLVVRRKGMDARKLRPGDREHFRGGVQLHRAGAERNHRMAERKVARFEPAQVAQHLGFAVMGVEDGVGEKGGFSIFDFRFATGGGGAREDGAIFAEDGEEHFDVVRRGRFVERNADAVRSERAQVAVPLAPPRRRNSPLRSFPQVDPDRVEEILVRESVAELLEAVGQAAGEVVDAARDFAQAFRPVIDRHTSTP